MENIILYQMEKELYLLEFEDSTGAAVDDQANIQVGYHSEEYGGGWVTVTLKDLAL